MVVHYDLCKATWFCSVALADWLLRYFWSANPLGPGLPPQLVCYLLPEHICLLKLAHTHSSCLPHTPVFSNWPVHTPTQLMVPTGLPVKLARSSSKPMRTGHYLSVLPSGPYITVILTDSLFYLATCSCAGFLHGWFFTLKMEVICYSKTSVHIWTTWHLSQKMTIFNITNDYFSDHY
jgi:hypothetical protein